MEMPEANKCFGIFPAKYATYLISIFGMASGLTGITGIVLYGLIENALFVFITGRDVRIDDTLRKVTLLGIGITSLMLTVANTLLFLGATGKSTGALASGVWIILIMCLILISIAIAGPLSCFFIKSACVVKKISTAVMALSAIALTVFLEIWLYFMVVANTYLNQL